MSGSMQGAKETAVRQGVSDFLSTIQNTAYADYVNVGIVGYSSPGNYVTGASGYITVPIDKVSSESHVKSINQALAPQFSGGTLLNWDFVRELRCLNRTPVIIKK